MPVQQWAAVDGRFQRPLEVLLEAVPIVLLRIDESGIITYTAGHGLMPLGAKAVDLIGRSYRDVYRDVQWLLEAVDHSFKGDIVRKLAAVDATWLDIQFVPEREGDSIVGVVGLSIDVTDQNRTESLLRATLDSSANGVLVNDLDGKISLFNRRFVEMWRIPAPMLEARVDQHLLEYVVEQLVDPQGFLARVRELYEHPEIESFDEIRFKDGRCFERHSRPQAIGTRIVGRVWSFLDVTRGKQAEEALQRAVHVRDEFLSIASHELYTPIHSLTLALQMLSPQSVHGLSEEQTSRTVDLATRQVQRLTQLVDTLLDVTRVDMDRLTLERERVDLGALVREVAERFRADEERSGSKVTIDAPPGIAGDWDRSRLEQVVTNLVSNAIKFGQGRPIHLTVSTLDSPRGLTALVSVHDHGIGLAPDELERVFERFARAVSPAHFGGLGLGLYVSNKIVEAHGGKLHVTSQIGQGATFTMTLPFDLQGTTT